MKTQKRSTLLPALFAALLAFSANAQPPETKLETAELETYALNFISERASEIDPASIELHSITVNYSKEPTVSTHVTISFRRKGTGKIVCEKRSLEHFNQLPQHIKDAIKDRTSCSKNYSTVSVNWDASDPQKTTTINQYPY